MSTKKRLTYEELRAFPGFENHTDQMAEETIKSLETMSILFYELHQKSIMEKERLRGLLKKDAY